MRTIIAASITSVFLSTSALAGSPFVVKLNENNRYFRNSGTITLYDPWDGHIIGEYKFVTGGAGQGALPLGSYEIGAYRDDGGTSFTRDSKEFRRRWMIRQTGLEDGEALDKNGKRNELELHSIHSSGRTIGCMGVMGGPEVWDDFVSKLQYVISSVGVVPFEIAANPEGSEGETFFEKIKRFFTGKKKKKHHHEEDKIAKKHEKHEKRHVRKHDKEEKHKRVRVARG